MTLYTTYTNNARRKGEEITKLRESLARENKNIATQSAKIVSARRMVQSSKSQSTIKSKLSEIQRAEEEISKIRKK